MNSSLDCRIAAGFLASGRVLAGAGHGAAILGGAGVLLGHSAAARLLFAGAVLCWPAILYFSLRVAIDARLFEQIDLGSGEARTFDAWLERNGMRKGGERTIDSRIRGALSLWRRLIAATSAAAALAVAGVIVEAVVR